MPNQSDVQGVFKGLNLDMLPEQLQEGEFTYALNVVIEPGNLLSIVTEGGTIECLNDIGYIVGYQYIPNKDLVIAFVVDENDTNSRIVKINLLDCTKTTLFQDECLNFSIHNQIRTTYKQLDICGEIVVVFVQRGNPVRYYNIDKEVTTCEDLNLFGCSSSLNLKVANVLDSGGAIPSGKYWFLAGYSDEAGNVEAVTDLSQEISIIDDPLSASWHIIDGAPANTPTSKVVELEFSNLNENKEFIALFVVSTIDYEYFVKKIILRYNGVSEYTYVYNGLDGFVSSLEELSITSLKFLAAELVTQHEDRLILGRLRNPRALDYQKQANNIEVKWFTSKISSFGQKKCELLLTNGTIYPSASGYTIRRNLTGFEVVYGTNYSLAGDIYNMINFAVTQALFAIRFLDVTGFEHFAVERISNVQITASPGAGGNNMVTFDYDFATPTNEYSECNLPWVTNTSFPPFITRTLTTNGVMFYTIERELTEQLGFKAYKNPLTSLYKTFMGNENYALCLWWEFCDGTFSNGFHIPGTTLKQVNECFQGVKSYTVNGDDLTEVFYPNADSVVPENDINNPFNCEKFVWQIFDTSCIEESPFETSEVEIDDCGNLLSNKIGVWQRGTLGYYEETCLVYPTTTDCEDELIYPHTETEEGITMDNVRHHRMPSRRTVPHYKSNNGISPGIFEEDAKPYEDIDLFPIGIEVLNITPPLNSPQPVVGYHIGFVKRTQSNSSVIAKGLVISSLYYDEEDAGNGYFFRHSVNSDFNKTPIKIGDGGVFAQGTTDYPNNNIPYKFFSPDTHFDIPLILNSQFLQVEQEWYGKGWHYDLGDVPTIGNKAFNINMEGQTVLEPLSSEASASVNRKITSQTYIRANENLASVPGITGLVFNFFGVSGVVFGLESKTETPSEGLLKYENECISDIADESVVGAIVPEGQEIDCAKAHYVSINKSSCNQYGDIYSLVYIPTGYSSSDVLQSSIKVFGDSFINYFSFFRTSLLTYGLAPALNLPIPSMTLIHGVFESNINVDLRHEGAQELGEVYYPKLANGFWGLHSSTDSNPPERCLLEQFYMDEETDDLSVYGYDNIKNYNLDYSRQPDFFSIFAPSSSFKPCNCSNELLNDFAVSLPHNEVSDGWKIFRPANIFSIPRSTGEVMNLFSHANAVYAHTTDNMWKVFTSQDRLLSDTSSVYIGSGSIFTQTPQYLYSTKEGYAGLQQMDGWCLSANMYFWVDGKSGEVFVLSSGVDKLSTKGMYKWFRQNAKPKLNFEGYAGKGNYANPFSGTGWHIAFDFANNRLLVTNRDYTFVDSSRFGGLYSEVSCELDKVYYDAVTKKFVLIIDATDCAYTIVDFSNTEIFCSKSWTISYNFSTEHWISWHNYYPLTYITTRDELYSAFDKKLVVHNSEEIFSTYYGVYYPSSVELVAKKYPIADFIWENIAFTTEGKTKVGERFKDTKDTFTHLIAWHENDLQQNSGKLQIMPRVDDSEFSIVESITDYAGVVKATRRNGTWFINELYNYIKDQELPVWEGSCNGNDKEIINNNIDFFKDHIYLDRFRANHLHLRFIFDNFAKNNVKIIFKYLISILER